MHRLNRPQVTVGIDGSLYKFHPRFRERMTDIIDKLKPDFVHVSVKRILSSLCTWMVAHIR